MRLNPGLSRKYRLLYSSLIWLLLTLSVWSYAQVRVGFERSLFEVSEGETVHLTIVLDKPADSLVRVLYKTEAVTAVEERNVVLAAGELVFQPGETEQQFIVRTIHDQKYTGPLTARVSLAEAEGARLSFRSEASIRILNIDPPTPGLLEDFETAPDMSISSAHSLIEVRQDDPLARPNQGVFERMLQLGEPAQLSQRYLTPENWQGFQGLGFWFYGQASGEAVTVTLSSGRAAAPPSDTWALIFEDTFDAPAGTPPNPAIWNYELGDGREYGIVGWGNDERQTYTDLPENASHDGEGHLVITALELPEDSDLRCHYGPCRYSSARIHTAGKLETAYGRIEARLKLPEGQGIWPGFWTLGSDFRSAGWPTAGEIDIMEALGHQPMTIHGTIHGPGYSGAGGIGRSYRLSQSFAEAFHVYALEWEPDELRWYVDESLFSRLRPEDVSGPWVFDQPFFIIFNVAVGGYWPGYPDASTSFPQRMLIDYLRIYALPDTSEPFSTSFVDDTPGWRFISLPFAEFTNDMLPEKLMLDDIWGFALDIPVATYLDFITLIEHE